MKTVNTTLGCKTVMLLVLVTLSTMGMITNTMAAPTEKTEVMKMVVDSAKEAKLAPSLALAVARAGSNFRPMATGANGEQGVMQIHPRGIGKKWDITPEELLEPKTNIKYGVSHLKNLTKLYPDRTDLALSHFYGLHIGSSQQLTHVIPTTRNLVSRTLLWQKRYQKQAQIWTKLPVPEIKYAKNQNRTNSDCNYPNSDSHDWPVDDFFYGDIEERRIQARSILDDFGDDEL
jgi:hypothetical protein